MLVNSQCRQIPGTKTDVREEFHGTKGILYLADGVAKDYKGKEIWRFEGKRNAPYQEEHNVLHDAIRSDKAHNDAYYGATSTFTRGARALCDVHGQGTALGQSAGVAIPLVPGSSHMGRADADEAGCCGQVCGADSGQFKIG